MTGRLLFRNLEGIKSTVSMEQYVYKANQKLRCGYTTGSCATAAAKAAAIMLLTKKKVNEISIMTPKGIELKLKVEDIQIKSEKVSCAIRKDAGDDADCTDGILIYATVTVPKSESSIKIEKTELEQQIEISGGIGVGKVTKAGLEQDVGSAAINRVPRQMIREALLEVMESCSYTGKLSCIISAPEGVEIAKKTFNPRLGIEGGISILGTSGIVEPMSEQALINTIHTEMKMKTHSGKKTLLVTPGNYGRDFAKEKFGIDLDVGLKCSNYIGETIDMAYEFQLEKMLIIGHVGKLIKIAAGIMNTHSRYADARMEVLCAAAVMAGADNNICRKILECITTDDALTLLEENNLTDKCMKYIISKIDENLNRRAYAGLRVEVIMFSNVFGILGKTENALKLLEELSYEQQQ